MAKLFYAVIVALLVLGIVITQGAASLPNFPELGAIYAFKADTGNLHYLKMVRDGSTTRIKAVGGASTPPSTSLILFQCDEVAGKVTCQPLGSQGYLSREDGGHFIEVSPTAQGVRSEFTVIDYDPVGPATIPNSGYLHLQADTDKYWSIGPSNTIVAFDQTSSLDPSTRFVVVKLFCAC